MAVITIDGKQFTVEAGQNLLQVCLSLGFDLPYFCWHPSLGSVGACRQCAVKQYRDEQDTQGRIIMSCMTPVTDGMRITVNDPDSKAFRASVIEMLMTNHPHDCPICDEGGECHLQDMTVMSGHNYRDYRFKKRTFTNQYLGPFINHEMNRCITCYRCVRFYKDYAGGRDLDVFASKNHVYFGRFEEGTLESPFSGNLVEVCPTGVFTDKTLKEHYTRKWDMQSAPGICQHCGVGCNILSGERYGELRRILNRYNSHVNGYFLCDRGRFGYSFVNGKKRIRHALQRASHQAPFEKADARMLLRQVAEELKTAKVMGIGSPRASLESNFALRTLVGADRFFNGLAGGEAKLVARGIEILTKGPARSACLHDAEHADAVLILGEDVLQTAPLLALKLRQTVRSSPMAHSHKINIPDWHALAVKEVIQDDKGPFYIASFCATGLDDIATKTLHAGPDEIALLGYAVAHRINPSMPEPVGLSQSLSGLADEIAGVLKAAERPIVVTGISSRSEEILKAAANVAFALSTPEQPALLSINFPECNTLGVGLMEEDGLDSALNLVKEGCVDTAIILENDLSRRMESGDFMALISGLKKVVVIDHQETSTTLKAHVVFPAGTFAEASGTLVNSEGRAQEFLEVFDPSEEIQESWHWLRDLMIAMGNEEARNWVGLAEINHAMGIRVEALHDSEGAVIPSVFRIKGLRIPRQPHRYSGRTAMKAHLNIHEQKPPEDLDTPLAYTMEGFYGKAPAPLISRFWAPGWNSGQSLNKFQSEINGPLAGGDPGVRLFEPVKDSSLCYAPSPGDSKPTETCFVPLYHLFGSDELSMQSLGVEARAPKPYLGISRVDADSLGLVEGVLASIAVEGATYSLPVQIIDSLPKGLAGIPVGLPGVPVVDLPVSGRISKGGSR